MESGGELEVENIIKGGTDFDRSEVESITPEEDNEKKDSGVEHRDGGTKQDV